MQFMHNSHGPHASRETTESRLEPPDYVRCDCGGEKRHSGSIPPAAKPAGGEPRVAARPCDVSRRPSAPLAARFRTHLAGPQDSPGACGIVTQDGESRYPESVRPQAGEKPLSH